MSATNRSAQVRSRRTDAVRRAQWLSDFERSGLSAAEFTRQRGLNYTTFCGWRQRRDKAKASPGFIQVEVDVSVASAELVIELGAHARMRVQGENQIALAARLLQRLASC